MANAMPVTRRKEAVSRINKTLRLMRCFEECTEALAKNKPLPLPLCYERAEVYLKLDEQLVSSSIGGGASGLGGGGVGSGALHPTTSSTSAAISSTSQLDSNVYLFDAPIDDLAAYLNMLNNFEYLNSNHVIDKNVIDYLVTNSAIRVNSLGKWILVTKLKVYDQQEGIGRISKLVVLNPPLWLLRYRFGEEEQQIKLFEAPKKNKKINKWIFYTEASYNLVKNEQELNEKFKPNLELMKSLSDAPKNWSSELDEDLAELIKEFVDTDMPGSIRNLIKNISLSSQQTIEDTDNLMSFDKRTYWESDSYSTSYNGCNSIRLFMKPYKIIKKMYITVSKKHRMYMPKEVSVYGGDNTEDIDELNKITIKLHDDGDVLILENCKKIYNYIEIRIKSCQRSSTNCRVYGIKIYTSSDQESLSGEIFTNTRFQRNFPRLAPFKTTFLYRRAELLLRFIKLFDICMDAMLPSWTYSDYFENSIKSVKKLLILSTKRINLLEKILNSIPTTHCYLPLIYIDRQLAFATRGKPDLDPKYQNTIFMQIYHNLSRSYSFRWDKNVEQWWECKFYGEGIIDQGGGFRDSLSDMAEELCPNTSALDSHSQSSQHQSSSVPLPFFIRSPNQLSRSDSNTFRDTFTVNPSCTLFDEYEFIGKLMGACFRSKETLALYLAPFFWKKLSGETVSWTDYSSIDAAEVKLIEHMEKINKHDYELKYGELRTWTCLLSDGTVYKLKEDCADKLVGYEERLEYCEMVKRVRMNESDKQIDAIRRGLQSVLSKHIFCLLTWSEFELKICGAPNITVEDLRMSIVYEDDMSTQDKRVKYFWEAISNFSNDERSKFVRFVTGRKRLPVKILFCLADQPATSFPDTSTCNCSIYFPNYPNAQVAEEKLRYAIHNCVAIDTDCASYDDL